MKQLLSDNSTHIIFQQDFDVIWVPYNTLHVSNYRKYHHDKTSDVVVLMVEVGKTHTRVQYGASIWQNRMNSLNY